MKPKIRQRLESHLAKFDTFPTAWEGVKVEPVLPYQAVHLTMTSAKTGTISQRGLAEEQGFLQITLFYPVGLGMKDIEQRASDLRAYFYGWNTIANNLQLVIHSPPLIGGAFLSGNAIALPITINFTAYELEE